MESSSKLLVCRFPRPDAEVKLICFPWAAGGANFYSNQWGRRFPDFVEVHGVCLAGREGRFKDPMYTQLADLLDDVTSAIHTVCRGSPFALWGHSFGAYLSYETACLLKSGYNMEPIHVFVSGNSAPHSEARKSKKPIDVKNYTDDQFIEHLKQFGGTPSDIIENRELMALFIPALRADYTLIQQIGSQHPSERHVMSCPVDVFDGKDDAPHDLESWRDTTTGVVNIAKLEGGHFYLKDEKTMNRLIKNISDSLMPCPL